MHKKRYIFQRWSLGLGFLLPTVAWSGQAQVAVAANFVEPIKAIAAVLEKTTGHTLKITVGSTGNLYAQIRNGAPFDVFLAADTNAPLKLETEGLTLPGSRFIYATGKLVLWSANATRVDPQGEILKSPSLGKVAYANPKTAPYGAAAVQTMEKLGVTAALAPRLVQGESVGQAFHFVYSGNADMGFLAMSQVLEGGRLRGGSMWVIPQALYSPIAQAAVVLKRAQGNEAAQALVRLMQNPNARALIQSYGYEL
jgi:molybdate transport system substrate-binding protein